MAEDRMDSLGREETGGIRDSAARVEGRAKKKKEQLDKAGGQGRKGLTPKV